MRTMCSCFPVSPPSHLEHLHSLLLVFINVLQWSSQSAAKIQMKAQFSLRLCGRVKHMNPDVFQESWPLLLTRVTWYSCVRFVSFLRNSGKRHWLSQNMIFTVLLLFVAGRSQCSSFNSQSAGFVSTFKRLNVYYSVQMIRLHTRYPTHEFLCIFVFIDFLGLPVRRLQISSHCRCSSVVLQCFILWAYFPAASRVLIHASGS